MILVTIKVPGEEPISYIEPPNRGEARIILTENTTQPLSNQLTNNMGYKKTDKCLEIAFDDEPIFVLLGRDPHAKAAVEYWAFLSRDNQGEPKLEEALNHADHMGRVQEAFRIRADHVKFNGSSQTVTSAPKWNLYQDWPILQERNKLLEEEVKKLKRVISDQEQFLIKQEEKLMEIRRLAQ